MIKNVLAACVLGAIGAAAQHHKHDPWDPLREQLDAWVFTEDFAVVVGNRTDRLFSYTHGKFPLTKVVSTESTSKWPLAMMMTGLVADGTIKSLDSPASEYLEWWTKDPEDSRHNVTLRSLLSFTSGFGSGHPGDEDENKTCMDDPLTDYMKCAKELYNTPNIHRSKPFQAFSYNSYHLQFAGAIAMGASKLPIQKLIKKYLFDAYGFTDTKCTHGLPNPQLAVCLTTTAQDYAKFLHKTLVGSFPSHEMVVESEKDYTQYPVEGGGQLYGDYGFGHFLMCFDSWNGYTAKCEKQNAHIDPGAFGFFPLIDRTLDYYMEVVAEENGKFYARSGIPEYLALAIKPIVDAIVGGETYVREKAGSHFPGFQSLTIGDVNYVAGCYADPSSCTDDTRMQRVQRLRDNK